MLHPAVFGFALAAIAVLTAYSLQAVTDSEHVETHQTGVNSD